MERNRNKQKIQDLKFKVENANVKINFFESMSWKGFISKNGKYAFIYLHSTCTHDEKVLY